MEKFATNIFLSKLGRLPANEVKDLVDKYEKDILKLSIVDANQILNYVERKFQIVSQWHNSEGMVYVLTFKMIATRVPE